MSLLQSARSDLLGAYTYFQMDSLGPGNLLTVDEGMRPRANSDPTVTVGGLLLPEIKVEDCTDPAAPNHPHSDHHHTLPFGPDDPPRPRSNTCPEDLFRKRNGRPPTPPPGTFRKGRKFKSGFSKPVMKESVSFAHHRLSKLAESEDVEDNVPVPASSAELEGAEVGRVTEQLSQVDLNPQHHRAEAGGRCPLEGKTSAQDSCSAQQCGPARAASAENCTKNVSDVSEDSFLSQKSVKCRCAQGSSASRDSTQLQAC